MEVLHPSKLTRLSNRAAARYSGTCVLHPSKLTRLSNRMLEQYEDYPVLHPSKLTRLSNNHFTFRLKSQFYTLQNLQDSQTVQSQQFPLLLFYTLQNLQDSQTNTVIESVVEMFYTLQNLQDSQTRGRWIDRENSFTPFKTYKTLKRTTRSDYE